MEIENIENIDRLIANCLTGKATDEEFATLNRWIKASKSNYNYFHQIQNIWDATNPEIKISDEKILEAFKKVEIRIVEKPKGNSFLFYLQRIAAVLIIPLIIGAYLIGSKNKNFDSQLSDNVVYNEVKAAYGTRSSFQLPDGSKVWLNSGSSLKYPVIFSNSERDVNLIGEAYFEVQSNKSNPFIVHTKSLDVVATGTKFNVHAFSSSKSTEVALLEGNVEVLRINKNTKSALKSNQHLTYDSISGKANIQEGDVYRYIAWKDGKLIFRGESLNEVALKISLLYNVDIELQGKKLQEQKYWGTFQEESLNNILKFLKISSPIDYREITAKPSKDGTFPKKKYLIFQTGK